LHETILKAESTDMKNNLKHNKGKIK